MNSLLALCVLVALFASAELVSVDLEQGKLEGKELTTIIKNITYSSFLGIPYATPPVGNLRFKAPQPPRNWTGVRDATSDGASCPQIDIFTQIPNPGSEDCLFINVHTPNLTPSEPLAVIVYIHGGGYKSGSGNSTTYGPDFLMPHGVVLVTFNYRLEALGFISMGTKECPGNAGLKDQVAALQWVKKNIAKFGGNPKKVTIMGQSAGSASVGYHIVSPMSKGLFQRAIGLSGVPFNDFGTEYKPVERAFALGKQLGINTHNSTELLNHLQSVPVNNLYNTSCTVLTSEERISNLIKFYNFVPVIEKDFGKNTFISKDVLEIMKNGTNNDVDVMFGYTSNETSTVVDIFNSSYLKIYDTYAEMLTPLKIFFRNTPDVNYEVARRIHEYYFGDKPIDANTLKQFITFTSDQSFVYDIIRFMTILKPSKRSHYLYKFSASSGLNTYGNQAAKYGFEGNVGHMDDLNYLFYALQNISLLTEGSTELQFVDRHCTLITNFAKYGNPTPKNGSIATVWPKFDTTKRSYMEIGNTLTVGTNPEADMMALWKSIYEYVKQKFTE